jgi:hypothetical protein
MIHAAERLLRPGSDRIPARETLDIFEVSEPAWSVKRMHLHAVEVRQDGTRFGDQDIRVFQVTVCDFVFGHLFEKAHHTPGRLLALLLCDIVVPQEIMQVFASDEFGHQIRIP